MYDINRFVEKQKEDYATALKEIKNGKKISHWMWYIFPQVKGLGESYVSTYYGIDSINEAKEYLENDYLNHNLKEICRELLKLNDKPENIFGSIDSLKLKSSMTLFYLASDKKIFKKVLDKFYDGELDKKTITILNYEEHKKKWKRKK